MFKIKQNTLSGYGTILLSLIFLFFLIIRGCDFFSKNYLSLTTQQKLNYSLQNFIKVRQDFDQKLKDALHNSSLTSLEIPQIVYSYLAFSKHQGEYILAFAWLEKYPTINHVMLFSDDNEIQMSFNLDEIDRKINTRNSNVSVVFYGSVTIGCDCAVLDKIIDKCSKHEMKVHLFNNDGMITNSVPVCVLVQ